MLVCLDSVLQRSLLATCRFKLFNVHLTPVVLKQGDRITAALAALSDAETKHESEIAAIAKKLDTTRPTIVLGDFTAFQHCRPTTMTKMGLC